MTGTLSGYLVYRLQDSLRARGYDIPYQDMIDVLSKSLLELEHDMLSGEYIELPTGRGLTISTKTMPVTNQQAIEALDHIVKNPQRDAEDTRTLQLAVSVLKNFIEGKGEGNGNNDKAH